MIIDPSGPPHAGSWLFNTPSHLCSISMIVENLHDDKNSVDNGTTLPSNKLRTTTRKLVMTVDMQVPHQAIVVQL